VLFHTTHTEYLKEDFHMFDALGFLAELTLDAWASNTTTKECGMTSPSHPAEAAIADSPV
jgi:hypothetical protein